MQNKRTVGTAYEKLAGAYLEKQGYEIVEYNFHSRNGEIDIVAKQGETIVFVEVKYRKNSMKGYPLEAITLQKQRSICKCALYYLNRNKINDMQVRFDVVGIIGDEIQVIQNAFDFVL